LPLVVVAAGHDHVGAFVGEGHRGGAADAGEGAGYENNLLSHLFPSATRNSADLTVAFATDAQTIDVAVGCNTTNTSPIPKLVLSRLAN
jgi:hypothetical protein